tara:strand:+ start:2003 stop:2272 length:270 start_codon:yes stop_codon:yes gene_type:complete
MAMFNLNEIPNGWLTDPRACCLLHFHNNINSFPPSSFVYMDKWEPSSKKAPSKFKNRVNVDLYAAIETWNELVSNGWRQIDYKFYERDA